MKWIRNLALAACIVAIPAYALDTVLGSVVSSGASVNNRTTATPFDVPGGQNIAVQCSAAAYVFVGTSSSAAATANNGVKVPADTIYDTATTTTNRYVAIIPVTGSATCKVFQVTGARVVRGGMSSSSGGICSVDDTQPVLAPYFRATTATGPGLQCDGIVDPCVKLSAGGTRNTISTNLAGDVCLGGCTGSGAVARIPGDLYVSNVAQVAGAVDAYLNSYFTNTSFNPLKIDDGQGVLFAPKTYATFPTCAATGSYIPGQIVTVVADATSQTRRCLCLSTGGGSPTFRWRNLETLALSSTASDCPVTSP